MHTLEHVWTVENVHVMRRLPCADIVGADEAMPAMDESRSARKSHSLEPSFVVTIHSAQGQTTSSMTYHNDRGTRSYFTQSLHYVALSRNTSFDTLKLANPISMHEFHKFKPQVDAVTAEMNRLRLSARFMADGADTRHRPPQRHPPEAAHV